MFTTQLLHPEMLASAGHSSQVLIADGNDPFGTGANSHTRRV